MKITMQLLNILTIATILLAPASASGSDGCDGIYTGDQVTQIDFFNSKLLSNTLHLEGGELRYEGVGKKDNISVDLVITDASSDKRYPDIVKYWEDRGKDVPTNNGLNGKFGQINLQTVPKKPLSGFGEFLVCFVQTGTTDKKVTMNQFDFTLYDIDNRATLREKLLIDADQALHYKISSDSELEVECEDESATPCVNQRTVFHGTTVGRGSDNPKDPLKLSTKQKMRSVTFTFVDRACFEIAYNHYCPGEKEGSMSCNRGQYDGGNFLFAGDSPLSTEPGECITKPPTDAPTGVPTTSPTSNPTSDPTTAPTGVPTNSPTSNPTADPTTAPTVSPTTESPTSNPTADPTTAPTGTPTNSPTGNPTADPTAAPTVSPTTESPTDFPTFGPTSPELETGTNVCELPPTTCDYGIITKGDARVDSKLIYGAIAVGGTYSRLSFRNPPSQTVRNDNGAKSYVVSNKARNVNFNGNGVQTISHLDDVIDFEQFEWLARNVEDGSNNGMVRVITSLPSTNINMGSVFPRGCDLQDYDKGKRIVIFNLENAPTKDFKLVPCSNGRKFGPSVIAPWSEVTLSTDFIDGSLVAKSLKGDNSNQQFHSECYSGSFTCPTESTAGPTLAPTDTPTVSPTNSPTLVPTAEPTFEPTSPRSNTNAPTNPITRPPSTDSPTGTPTNAPTDSPTYAPSIAATDSPTSNPTASPTATPTVAVTALATARPTLPDNPCPEDIELLHIDGNYPIDLQESVKILDQNKDTVKVRLVNAFTSPEDTIDSIFYQYKPDDFNEKCYEAQDVSGGTSYEDITIQCLHSSPFAKLMICVADLDSNPLSEEDNAKVPECCHDDLPDDAQVVCYHLLVYCESTCVDATSRRFLRGFTTDVANP